MQLKPCPKTYANGLTVVAEEPQAISLLLLLIEKNFKVCLIHYLVKFTSRQLKLSLFK